MTLEAYRFKEVEADRFTVFEKPVDPADSWKAHRSPEYWEYRRQWTGNAAQGIAAACPLNIDLELTSRCNLRCTYCKRTEMQARKVLGVSDMDFALARRILDEVDGQTPAVKLNIRGEPLLYDRIVEVVALCKRRGVREVLMNTNGMLLTEDLAGRLLGAGLDTIIFSFDFADKERLEANRVGARFETIVANIRGAARQKRSGGHKGVKLRANTFFDTDLAREVAALRELWGDDIDEFTISKVNPTYRATNIDLDACAGHFDAIGWQCPQPWQRLGVFSNGDVIFCCTDFEGRMKVGNAKETSIHDLWHAPKVQEVRRLHLERQGYRIPMCRTCHNFIHQVIKHHREVLDRPYPVRKDAARQAV